ncbi:uncharacterized protein CXorf65-like [Amphiura filiformis]|uniref:uncharacterized protein CXorf65-like n=1 Tax=Amphiura filiformis TaxID=82378 RepID=UPI003B21ECAE
MFITVRFGDDCSEMFNPNCKNIILLNNIKQRCKCNDQDVVDLSDESGSVAHLPSHLQEYGKNYLADRGTFILVRVETKLDEGNEVRVTYVPLLNGMDSNKEFIDRLNPRPAKTGKKLRRAVSSMSNDSGRGSDKRKNGGKTARKISGVINSLKAAKR